MLLRRILIIAGALLLVAAVEARERCTLEQRATLAKQGVIPEAINSLCGFLTPEEAEQLRLQKKPRIPKFREPPPECRQFLENALVARGTDQTALELACTTYLAPPQAPEAPERAHLLILPLSSDIHTFPLLRRVPSGAPNSPEPPADPSTEAQEGAYFFEVYVAAMAPILSVSINGIDQPLGAPGYELHLMQALDAAPGRGEVVVRVRTTLAEETRRFPVFLEHGDQRRFRGQSDLFSGGLGVEALYDTNAFLDPDPVRPVAGKRLRYFGEFQWTRHVSAEERWANAFHWSGVRHDRPELQPLDQTQAEWSLEWQRGLRNREEWSLGGGWMVHTTLPNERLLGLRARQRTPFLSLRQRNHAMLGRSVLELREEFPDGGGDPALQGQIHQASALLSQRVGDQRGSVLIQARRFDVVDSTEDRLQVKTWFRWSGLARQADWFGRIGVVLDQHDQPAQSDPALQETQQWELGAGFWPQATLRWEFRLLSEKRFAGSMLLHGRTQLAIGASYAF
jgi:hypothetical protein